MGKEGRSLRKGRIIRLCRVQHGDALPKDVDPQRGLSNQGRQDVTNVALAMEKAGMQVKKILHSGKKRAEQTALLFQSCLAPGGEFGEIDGILRLDPVDVAAITVEDWQEDTMLVGHLPFMGKLAALLVTGNESTAVVRFQPGSVACLQHEEIGSWVLLWMVRSELLRQTSAKS